ncbi:MAG TPA: MBL fold metallo-hydrolase [Clostridia bacterium]|nr:MBL fold metallo-hydrolase [Clostridia bacterium]
MEIRVHEIGSYVVRNYVLETPAGWIVLDTGYRDDEAVFCERFEKLAPLDQIKYIFLTHAHDDHAGFLSSLLGRTNAALVLHESAVPQLAMGKNATPPGAGYSSRLASSFALVKKEFGFPAVIPDEHAIVLHSEADQPFLALGLPLRVVFLPGHTADSIALFDEETRFLYCGDAAMNAVISRARHTIWIEDPAEFGRSWDKMIALEPRMIFPSHGNPFLPKDLVKYRHFMDRRKLIQPKAR